MFSAASREEARVGSGERLPRAGRAPGNLAALVLLIFGGAAALSIDVVRAGDGVKGDEATYVSMALSAAYDGDLAFERRDLERFWRIYNAGPEGIFLKLGARTDRLYYGKAFAYSVAAAPFVRLAGVNGLLFFNVVLLVLAFLAAYHFLAARTAAGPSLVLALGFLAASVAPLYVVWLTSEVFNLALVVFAYFLWLYKDVAPPAAGRWGRWLRGEWSDVAAAVLLGIGVYSKLLVLPLIAPLVALRFWRGEWRAGLVTGLVAAATIALAFGANAAVSGDPNYQGGERKTFYGKFPFDAPDATFANRGVDYATDAVTAGFSADPGQAVSRLGDNLRYFAFGRYTGLLAYYFPAVVAVGWCLLSWRRVLASQWLVLGALALAIGGMLIWLPFTWAGGGGAPGNRYFLGLYPALFFVIPPIASMRAAMLPWAGAVFMAPLLANPFVTSTRPWQHAAHGPFRFLPVELTMMNDLPIMIDPGRGRVPYGSDPELLLYFLDDRAWREPERLWIAGAERTEIVVRSGERLDGIRVTVRSPVPNVVRLNAGGETRTIEIGDGQVIVVQVPADVRPSRGGYACVLSIETSAGFVPHLVDPGSPDGRFLGVEVQLAGVRGR